MVERIATCRGRVCPSVAGFVESNRRLLCWLLLWTCVLLSAMLGLLVFQRYDTDRGQPPAVDLVPSRKTDTLVIYTYSNADPSYRQNLEFLLNYGMWEGDGCKYLILGNNTDDIMPIKQLPSNVYVLPHRYQCLGWGAVGEAYRDGVWNETGFKYMIFLDSSVRGPFLPLYWPTGIHWSRILTSRLSSKVKLVGSTISCEPAYKDNDSWKERRFLPWVQPYAVATDEAGFKAMLNSPEVFACYTNIFEKRWHTDLGASAAIYAANYTIDSLMVRYQGVDWLQLSNHECNAMVDPTAEFAYDGLSLDPMEVLFVKMEDHQLEARWVAQHTAATQTGWLQHQGLGTVNSNDYSHYKHNYRLGRIFTMQLRGSTCFDHEYYRKQFHHLRSHTDNEMWLHFVEHGQFEGRRFRFTCPDRLSKVGVASAAAKHILKTPIELTGLPADEAIELDYDLKEINAMHQEEVKSLHRQISEQILKAGKSGMRNRSNRNRRTGR